MTTCWLEAPESRPDFSELHDQLGDILRSGRSQYSIIVFANATYSYEDTTNSSKNAIDSSSQSSSSEKDETDNNNTPKLTPPSVPPPQPSSLPPPVPVASAVPKADEGGYMEPLNSTDDSYIVTSPEDVDEQLRHDDVAAPPSDTSDNEPASHYI